MNFSTDPHIYIYMYNIGLKSSCNDIIFANDDFFDQWDPSTAKHLEEVLKNKDHLVTFHKSIFVSL